MSGNGEQEGTRAAQIYGGDEKVHISYSQLRDFMDCQKRWHYGRIHPEERMIGVAGMRGISIHEVVSRSLLRFRDEGKHFEAEEAEKALKLEWDGRLAAGGVLVDPKVDLNDAYEGGVRALKFFLKHVAPSLCECHDTELTVTMPLGDYGYSLTGRLDYVGVDGTIRDFKFRGKSPSNVNPAYKAGDKKAPGVFIADYSDRMQQVVYQILCRHHFGSDWKVGMGYTDVITTAKTPKWSAIPHQVTSGEMQSVLDAVVRMSKQIETGIFHPNFGSMFCGQYNCSFFNRCHADHGVTLPAELLAKSLEVSGITIEKDGGES